MMRFSRAASSTCRGAARHKSPETTILVSRTARTLAPGLAYGVHLGLDFLHRHRWDIGCRHAVGGFEKFVDRFAAHRLAQQALDGLRREQPRGLGFARERIGYLAARLREHGLEHFDYNVLFGVIGLV